MSSEYLSGSDDIMKALNDIAQKMNAGAVEIGFMEGATYPDGTPVAAVAFWNEFGVPSNNTPPRPFFRGMIAKESPTWPGKMAKLAEATNFDGKKVLNLMGEDIQGALVESIIEFSDPPNAPSTIKAKGFNKPLIHRGDMKNAVTYIVTI
jgi:hypothetical protein